MFYECLSAVGACSQKTIAFIKQEGGKPFLRKNTFLFAYIRQDAKVCSEGTNHKEGRVNPQWKGRAEFTTK